MRALNIAATGMSAQNTRVEVISHNLANMSTTAYNARRAEFSDLHYQQMQRPGTINSAEGTVLPAGVQLGLGVRPSAVTMQIEQGTLEETGGALDVPHDDSNLTDDVGANALAGHLRLLIRQRTQHRGYPARVKTAVVAIHSK